MIALIFGLERIPRQVLDGEYIRLMQKNWNKHNQQNKMRTRPDIFNNGTGGTVTFNGLLCCVFNHYYDPKKLPQINFQDSKGVWKSYFPS